MRRTRYLCVNLTLTLWAFGSGAALAQIKEPPTPEEVAAAEGARLFTSHETLDLTIEADFSTMLKEDRTQDSEERPGVLRWTDMDGSPQTQEIQIRTRGNFRLAERNCDFPPLRLNVKKESTKGTLFEGQDKLKLVVACKTGQSYWEQYVLAEYLVYRMYNLLTPLSFRVRLVRATYLDSAGERDPFTRYAFLIEDDSDMATRNGGWKLDWAGGQLDPRLLEKHHAILVDLFQYMIGNTDWSGVEPHNIEVFERPDGPPSTVPFDFDFSGIVDARYANPDETLPIRSVRERIFRGFCPEQVGRTRADYEAVLQLFREKKEAIFGLWRSQEGLDRGRRSDSLGYLEEFYDDIETPDRIQRRLMRTCRPIAGG